MPKLWIPKEVDAGETRVAATPDTVKRYVKLGFDVAVEAGAGNGSSIGDQAFADAGAQLVADPALGYRDADAVLKLNPACARSELGRSEVGAMRSGTVFVGFVWPHQHPELLREFAQQGVTAFAMDQVPRITRAQKMDALSSQANIAGYKAVIIAAHHAPRLFPLLMTAAGTITPAKVVIMGAGVAGLQAIATAKRLGAVVEVSDVRPAVKEQVESLGGRFIDVPVEEGMEDSGGYAKEQSADFLKRQQDLIRSHIVEADVVITTAQIPGKPSPVLVPAEMVADMKTGAVVVDLAVEGGGNCALSQPDEIVQHDGVTILAYRNVAGMVPFHASEVYARNVLAVVQHLFGKDATLNVDLADDINTGAVLTHAGEVHWGRASTAPAAVATN